MKFLTRYDRFNDSDSSRVYSNSGSSLINTYKARYSDSGHFDVVLDGSHDIYPDIQVHSDSVDIYSILAQFERGQIDSIPERLSFYGDFADSHTLADYLNFVHDAEIEFSKLSVEERAKYDNSAIVWLSSPISNPSTPPNLSDGDSSIAPDSTVDVSDDVHLHDS